MSDMPVRCPSCHQSSTSIKRYTMITFLLFLGVFAYHQRATFTQCASCMRKTILAKGLINILPGNLLWMILLFPWYTVLFLMSLTGGHSSSVQRELSRF